MLKALVKRLPAMPKMTRECATYVAPYGKYEKK